VETRDGVFIHVSHGKDDPHRLLMALSMATMMSGDHPVLVYFDIGGVEAVLADAEDVTQAPFKSLLQQLAVLRQSGATLMACPGCLKAAGKTPEELAEGVEIAEKSRFFSFTTGRIVSLDY
jgi:predicted peroxiredoxin